MGDKGDGDIFGGSEKEDRVESGGGGRPSMFPRSSAQVPRG